MAPVTHPGVREERAPQHLPCQVHHVALTGHRPCGLVNLLLVRRLPPLLHLNIGKRPMKAAKISVRDSGLAHALFGIGDYNALAGPLVVGASRDGYVIQNLLSVAPNGTQASFFQTSAGAETDLVLNLLGRAGRWTIDIKRSLSAKPAKRFFRTAKTTDRRRPL